jgi:hypothetical protein
MLLVDREDATTVSGLVRAMLPELNVSRKQRA